MTNIVIGAGEVFFRPDGASGEYLLAQTPDLKLAIAADGADIYDTDSAVEDLLLTANFKLGRTITASVRDISARALGWFFGVSATLTQSAVTITGEALGKLEKGAVYQLGLTLQPTGSRNVSGVAVYANGFLLGLLTDYTLDSGLGRVTVSDDTALPTGAILTANFTQGAVARPQTTAQARTLTGALRFVADNTAGANRDLFWPSVSIQPTGDWALKSSGNDAQTLGFIAKALRPTTGAALYIDGRPIEIYGFDAGGPDTIYSLPGFDEGGPDTVYSLPGFDAGGPDTIY